MTTMMNLTAASNVPTCNLVTGNMMTGSGLGSNSKAITRLLQHSILQLCNEHIGYSHKLQILGVLCMTVDDEQQELVVKVNNTLKRVSPQGPNKDAPQQLASPSAHLNVYGTSLGQDSVNARQGLSQVDDAEQSCLQTAVLASDAVSEAEGTSTPRSSHSPAENARKGRKRSRPVRVDHVYDEGDMIDEEGGDILTVIPTDPDTPSENIHTQPIFLDDLSDNEEDVENEENIVHPPSQNSRPPKTAASIRSKSNPPSTASPNVRALLQQSIARNRSTGKQSPKQASQLRNALLNGAQCLTLPICVAPSEKRPSVEDSLLLNGSAYGGDNDTADDDHLGPLQIDEKSNNKYSDETSPLNDSGVSVKEEPKDEYDWSKAGQVTPLLQQDSVASIINGSSFSSNPFSSYAIAGMDGVTSLPSYNGFNLALASTINNSQQSDGLSIRYTPTGPITVGANGKNVSNQKVKDIIMYDDQSPLHQQKGARLETDFMVDKMGIEGRKRRRRAPDETLTLEEIAEYMGSSIITDPSIGNGTFKCKYCPVNVEDLISYLQHTLAVHNAYICHQCGKSFTTKSSLLRHRPIHTGMRRFACSICKKTFYRKDKCKAHIKRHFGEEGTVTQDVE